MSGIFLKLLNMSMSAGWVVLAVIVLRLLLKRAPRWVHCALWSMVGIRLLLPFSFESMWSLLPSTQTVSMAADAHRPTVYTGVPLIDTPVREYLTTTYFEGVTRPQGYFVDITTILAFVWIAGIALMVGYGIFSYLRLRKRVAVSLRICDNIYACDTITTPFILGVLRPRIYLPSDMEETTREHVLRHEKAHLSRLDHVIKPFAFALLAVYWFHPLLWLAYVLLCRDIEVACDQKAIRRLESAQRKAYSNALLCCASPRKLLAACPLAFGEVGVKNRVKSVLHYKKPTVWILLVAVLTSAAVAVCFLTDPKGYTPAPQQTYLSQQFTCQNGSLFIYSGPTDEDFAPNVTLYDMLGTEELAAVLQELKTEKWVDDTLVDRTNFNFCGKMYYDGWLYFGNADYDGKEHVVMYDNYFCVVSDTLFYTMMGKKYSAIEMVKPTTVRMDTLPKQYPQYYNLPTENDLVVYLWQDGEDVYRCGLLPAKKNGGYSADELSALEGITMEEMRVVLADYALSPDRIHVVLFEHPDSPYYFTSDERFTTILTNMFWGMQVPIEGENSEWGLSVDVRLLQKEKKYVITFHHVPSDMDTKGTFVTKRDYTVDIIHDGKAYNHNEYYAGLLHYEIVYFYPSQWASDTVYTIPQGKEYTLTLGDAFLGDYPTRKQCIFHKPVTLVTESGMQITKNISAAILFDNTTTLPETE